MNPIPSDQETIYFFQYIERSDGKEMEEANIIWPEYTAVSESNHAPIGEQVSQS